MCNCDVDYRCPNHDLEAEERYWCGLYLARPVEVDESLAYDRGDPKAFSWDDVNV